MLSIGDLKLSDVFFKVILKSPLGAYAFFKTRFHYFLLGRGPTTYTSQSLLCPTAELEFHLCKTHFERNPFWRWIEINKLQFHHSTCLNENEENKQKNMTSQHCNVRHLCFANAYYSHSRFFHLLFQQIVQV